MSLNDRLILANSSETDDAWQLESHKNKLKGYVTFKTHN